MVVFVYCRNQKQHHHRFVSTLACSLKIALNSRTYLLNQRSSKPKLTFLYVEVSKNPGIERQLTEGQVVPVEKHLQNAILDELRFH